MTDWSSFDFLPDAVLVAGAGGKIVYANLPAEDLFGCSHDELIGKDLRALLPEFPSQMMPFLIVDPLPSSPVTSLPAELSIRQKNGDQVQVGINLGTSRPDRLVLSLRRKLQEEEPVDEEWKLSQQLLVRRESHLAAVVETQHLLLAAEGKDLPMEEILELLGTVFHVSRVYLMANLYDTDEQVYMRRQYEWCATGIRPLKDDPDLQKVYYKDACPNWRRLLSQGKMIAGILADFPSEERRFMLLQDIQSILIFPMLVNGSFSGFMAFDDCLEPRQWQPSETSLLQVASTSVAMARDRIEAENHLTGAYSELAQRLVELSTLNDIIQTVASVTDLKQALELVATKICLLFDAASCSVALLNPEHDRLSVIVQYRRESAIQNITGRSYLLKELSASQQVIDQIQSLVVRDAQNDPLVAAAHGLVPPGVSPADRHCLLLTPLLSRGQVLGTIALDLAAPGRDFSSSEVRLAETIAAQIAGAIENARLYQEAQKARAVAEDANQAKSAFLASISHELRTPLNAILGFTQLLERTPNLTSMQRESLATILRSGDHLLGLINDVLDLSKIEAGRVTVQEIDFDLYYLLRGLEDMFALRAKTKGLSLRFETAPGTPRHIRSDESKLRQILINVLGNAVKFTSHGGIILQVSTQEGERALSSLQPGRPLTIQTRIPLKFTIQDTGPGIAPEDQERIFEPFVQSGRGTKAAEGTGLGLAISRQFARLLDGDITVNSRVGAGSTFTIMIPVARAATGELPADHVYRRVVGLEPGQPVFRILIAEDNDANRQLLNLLLTSVGFEVHGVENGAQAVQAVREWRPHLVWMDIRMPVMDGLEATRRIKASGPGAPAVVALTASAFQEDRARALEAGCDEYLSKPYREAEIFDTLSRQLGVRYIYDEQGPGLGHHTLDMQDEIETTRQLAALPPDLLDRLKTAALEGDILSLETILEEIGSQQASLGKALGQLANQFEYDRIYTLAQEAQQD